MHERKQRKRVQRANSGQVVQMCDVELCGELQRKELQKEHGLKKNTHLNG